jgi:isopentenyl-diphosphate delta-isomerase
MTREADLVELVDGAGLPAGVATVDAAHALPGRLHRAFSVLLTAPDGRLLLQRRAAAKTRFPLRWANACCGHPAPGEPVEQAAARRMAEEIGVREVALTQVGVYLYRARDALTDRVEHEYDHVLAGELPAGGHPDVDAAEVAAIRWVSPASLRTELSTEPDAYAPWLAGVLAVWEEARR